jgi:phosphopantothenoylcysteine decarboxylase/phosphopantothenate--cysteine ligase
LQNTAGSGSCTDQLAGKKIILGVTGSIAAYKAAYIASGLVKRGADVHVVMTQNATQLIGEATFWSITRNPVIVRMFEQPANPEITHVSLPESADLLLIAPASANIIGKLANGIADDMLSTMSLVVRCPKVIAPAMNTHMYTNPVVVANLDRLKLHDWLVVEPEEGLLACGDEGIGRLADPDQIIKRVEEMLLGRQDYAGVKVLVTAGPTREAIDPVRFISNRSSGKMGYAIAEAAAARGAEVTLVSGPTDLDRPAGVEVVAVTTVSEMYDAVSAKAGEADLFVSAGAPADFVPRVASDQKIKKDVTFALELDRAVDILEEIGRKKGKTILVGFAAETTNIDAYAREKLERKNLDLIVANDVSAAGGAFGGDTNQVTLISRDGETLDWPRMSKREVANSILDYVSNHFMEASR